MIKKDIWMKRYLVIGLSLFFHCIVMLGITFSQNVSNINPIVRGKLITVFYDLSGEGSYTIKLFYADSSGEKWKGPLKLVSGNVGEGQKAGYERKIYWDAASEVGAIDAMIKFKVLAEELKNSSANNVIEIDTSKAVSLIFNGAEYVKQFNTTKGDPFFPTKNNRGSIKYYNNNYNNIDILYDCEDHVVIIRDMNGLLKLRLIHEMLDEFFLDGHRFVKKPFDTPRGEFYESVYEGNRNVFIKWYKQADDKDGEKKNAYKLKRDIILQANNKLFSIKSMRDLNALAKNHTIDISKLLRTKKVSYRKNSIEAIKLFASEMDLKGW